MAPPNDRRPRGSLESQLRYGRAQLSILESSLCCLDPEVALATTKHESQYHYWDASSNRKTAKVSVFTPLGLSPYDEFYLWGALALTLSQPEPTPEFSATPYYILRRLGAIDQQSKGAENWRLLDRAFDRLAVASYSNPAFYDPVLKEHRKQTFGFFSFDRPMNLDSSRMWTILWDPLFYRFCEHQKGRFTFDLPTYRELTPADRRLFLLLQKVFHGGRDESPTFEVRHLAVDVLGYQSSRDTFRLKWSLLKCVERFLDREFISLPLDIKTPKELFTKVSKGVYHIRFHRGPFFDRTPTQILHRSVADSPLFEPLQSIGFEDQQIAWLLSTFKHPRISKWVDITQRALEVTGPSFFTGSPQAYIVDALKKSRTAPDWYLDDEKKRRMKREEEERRKIASFGVYDSADGQTFEDYLATTAAIDFQGIVTRITDELAGAGRPRHDAEAFAREQARLHLLNRYRQEHPEANAK